MGKRVGHHKPQKNTWTSRLIAFGDRVLEHWRILLAVLGVLVMIGGAAFDSTIDYEDTLPVTAHYERYAATGSQRSLKRITLYFTDHEPLSFGYKSTSQKMRTQISLIPPGEELIMRLHPVTHEILSLQEDDRTHFTFDQSQGQSAAAQSTFMFGLWSIVLAVFGRKRNP